MICPSGRALVLVWLSGFAAVWGQTYTYIFGAISDASASSVPGAVVTVVDEDTGFRRVTLSQPNGGYTVSSLQPGTYKITVRKPGFYTVIRFGVRLGAAQPERVDFKLVVGSVQETITVNASPVLLNTEDASVGTAIGGDEIERLPLNGHNLLDALELAPGVLTTPATRGEPGQFSVAGQRPNTNYFTVDGVSANSGVSGGGLPAQSTGGALPGMTAFGSLDNLLTRDSLQEMRIQTSSTAPEFGRLPGAQVSLTSRSGSNQFHGSLLYDFRNDKLDANDWFANRQGDSRAALRYDDFAASLGGPILRNRTFFFVSYEGLRMSQPFVWVQPVPSLDSRQSAPAWAQPILNLFPAPNGADLGNGLTQWVGGFSRPSQLDSGAARLDQAITSRLTAFARYTESPSSTLFGSNPVNSLELRTAGITAGLNLRATPNLVFDLRLNASDARAISGWAPAGSSGPAECYSVPSAGACPYLMRFSIAGVGQVVSGPEGRRAQSQLQAHQTGSWNRGRHSLQFGADYLHLEPSRRDSIGTVSLIATSLPDLLAGNSLWTSIIPQRDVSAVLTEISLFANDTWRLTPRLTLTYGLRWEISPAPQTNGSTYFLNPASGVATQAQRGLWRSTYANFAPRFGIAYRLTNDGRTVIRAGAGLYFDSSLSLATDLVNDGPLSVSDYSITQTIALTHLYFGFNQDLRLPLVKQWNVSLERALGNHDVLSVGYVGSSGASLIRREIGGVGSTGNNWLALATNNGSSNYQSLQAQYRRRMAQGLEAVASYAWSHSIDNSSTDGGLFWTGSGLTAVGDRASSDFDARHAVTAGVTYEMPAGAKSAAWRGWALDGMFHARTGFPMTLLDSEQYTGISFENVFRPDYIGGQPVWIENPGAPGGRQLNPAAFRAAPNSTQGNLGRNAIAGFGMTQLDMSLRREFFVREQRSVQLRFEAFNALNHANFADPVRFLTSPLFGQSSSMLNLMLGTGSPGSGLAPIFQGGGPRSLQVAIRFKF